MKRDILACGIAALAFGTGCGSHTHERVVVKPPPRAAEHRRPAREVIIVERTHVPRGRAYGWWKQHGYREVTLYHDGTSYYSRQHEPTGFRAVIVFQRDGKYFLPVEDDGKEKDKAHGQKKDHGRDRDKDK
jgi:hypothetical protein